MPKRPPDFDSPYFQDDSHPHLIEHENPPPIRLIPLLQFLALLALGWGIDLAVRPIASEIAHAVVAPLRQLHHPSQGP
jgi:hypothetical protein